MIGVCSQVPGSHTVPWNDDAKQIHGLGTRRNAEACLDAFLNVASRVPRGSRRDASGFRETGPGGEQARPGMVLGVGLAQRETVTSGAKHVHLDWNMDIAERGEHEKAVLDRPRSGRRSHAPGRSSARRRSPVVRRTSRRSAWGSGSSRAASGSRSSSGWAASSSEPDRSSRQSPAAPRRRPRDRPACTAWRPVSSTSCPRNGRRLNSR